MNNIIIYICIVCCRIKDTLKVGPDHTYGILAKPDEYGAGDLMHGRAPSNYLRGKDRQRGVLAAIRQHLKKANFHNFTDLVHAFRYYDKVKIKDLDWFDIFFCLNLRERFFP